MAEAVTSVHNIETTGTPRIYESYRAFRASSCPDELQATEELYSYMDNQEGKDRLSLLNGCRKLAWFARNKETNHVHVISSACRLRWCPLCSTGRCGYITHNLIPWISGLKHPRFLTLTLRHSNASLTCQINSLYTHFRTLRKNKWFRDHVAGGVWFFQIKLSSKVDQWHPHIHCILHGKYIPQLELSKLWLKITKTSNIVDIRMVRNPKEAADYVARYSARPAKLAKYPLTLRVEIFNSMHRRRLCGTWGSARGVSLSPPTSVTTDKFERLGTFSTVLFMRCTSADAKAIYEAWLDKVTLPPGISLIHVDNFIDDLPDSENWESDEVYDPQLPGFV